MQSLDLNGNVHGRRCNGLKQGVRGELALFDRVTLSQGRRYKRGRGRG